jgi:hypothetical protein
MPLEPSSNPAATADSAPPSSLQGWIPPLATEDAIRAALDRAFSYRGDVTLTLKDGTRIEGYIFDRHTASTLAESFIRLFPADQDQKLSISYGQIARLEFTGRDTAAGRSFQTWLEKYRQKKLAGESNIRNDPEPLE